MNEPLDTPAVTGSVDPFGSSLWGEYSRTLLVGTALCMSIVWAIHLGLEPKAGLMMVANVLVILAAVGDRFAGLQRLLLIVIATISVMLFAPGVQRIDQSILVFLPIVTVAAFGILLVRDGVIAIQTPAKPMPSPRKITLSVLILAAVVYMIVIPSIESIVDRFSERQTSYVIDDLTAFEVLRIRSAKLAVFAIFGYAGACVGSFLNVVAASAPRGETIALRSSACPKCRTVIRRIDNLPLLSYLNLRGRCRTCATTIPVRYFVVEWIGLSIFALLFLYELVTGAWNVPGFPHYHYTGILWIIMYTKWPVVGVYIFHCLLFSCLLTIALMEIDRLTAPRWMLIAMPMFFAGIAIVFPAMMTVSLFDQTPFQLPEAIPDWVDRAATCISGGGLGMILGRSTGSLKLRRHQSSASLAMAFALLGVSLGWQAILTIALIWLITMLLCGRFGGRRIRKRWLTPTAVLFLIAMLHHPIWEVLARNLSF